MKKFVQFLYSENFKSFLHTFWTDLVWDTATGATAGHIIFNGDFGWTTLSVLGYSVWRTFWRALREYFKKKYPKPNPNA